MNERHPPTGDFDARLRRAFADLDTAPGFEARVATRLAALHVESPDVLRARVERRQKIAAQRLRRETWANLASVAGVGVAAITLLWRHGPALAAWMEGWLASVVDPKLLGGVAVAVLAASLWPTLRGYLPR